MKITIINGSPKKETGDTIRGKGIIALDACTPVSKFVNCIVVED